MFPYADSDLVARRRPIINVTLIAISAVVFIYELLIGSSDRVLFFYQFGAIPAELAHGADYESLLTRLGPLDITSPIPNWATMFTSMFIHGDWLHFGANMLFLWVFGDNIEDRFGHLKYLLFYLTAGVAAVWLQVGTNSQSQVPTIGASGAIAGVLGAYLLLYPYSRIRTAVLFLFIFFVRIPAIALLGFWIVLQFMGGVGSLGPSAQSEGVAYWAHIGGFAFGMAIVVLYRLATGQRVWPSRPPEFHYWRGRPL